MQPIIIALAILITSLELLSALCTSASLHATTTGAGTAPKTCEPEQRGTIVVFATSSTTTTANAAANANTPPPATTATPAATAFEASGQEVTLRQRRRLVIHARRAVTQHELVNALREVDALQGELARSGLAEARLEVRLKSLQRQLAARDAVIGELARRRGKEARRAARQSSIAACASRMLERINGWMNRTVSIPLPSFK